MSQFATLWATGALSIAALLSIARVVRRGTVADRTIGLDILVVVLAAAVVTHAAATGVIVFLTVVSVVALLAFVATVTVARFMEPVGGAEPGESEVRPKDGGMP